MASEECEHLNSLIFLCVMALEEVYVLLIAIVSLVIGIPPLRWVYRTYIRSVVIAVGEKVCSYDMGITHLLHRRQKNIGINLVNECRMLEEKLAQNFVHRIGNFL